MQSKLLDAVKNLERTVMIIKHWQPWFTQQYGGSLPRSYLCYDIETSGFSREHDVILEFGHCLVHDGKLVDRNSVVLNWFLHDTVPHSYLREQLANVARNMQIECKSWRLTERVLEEEGIHPITALPYIFDLLSICQNQGLLMVTSNGWNFDNPMLVSHFEQDLEKSFTFNSNQIFDVGCIVKASQLVEENQGALPKLGESLLAYFKRISGWRAQGVYSNLAFCVKKYGLDQKYNVDLTKLHTASEDAYVLHLLMEEFRTLLEEPKPVTPKPVTPKPPAPVLSAQQYRKTRNR